MVNGEKRPQRTPMDVVKEDIRKVGVTEKDGGIDGGR